MMAAIQLTSESTFILNHQIHIFNPLIGFVPDVDYKSQALASSEEFQTIFSNVRKIAKKYFRLASKEMLNCERDTDTDSNSKSSDDCMHGIKL